MGIEWDDPSEVDEIVIVAFLLGFLVGAVISAFIVVLMIGA